MEMNMVRVLEAREVKCTAEAIKLVKEMIAAGFQFVLFDNGRTRIQFVTPYGRFVTGCFQHTGATELDYWTPQRLASFAVECAGGINQKTLAELQAKVPA